MNDERSFLAAMAVSPDDDLLRLAFADWLEERGEDARAEFIRCQVGPARDERRAEELLQAHREEWERPFRAAGAWVSFHRGLPWFLQIEAARLPVAADVLGLAPEWNLYLTHQPEMYPRAFARLAQAPHADRIRGLTLLDGVTPDELEALLVPRVARRVRGLRFGYERMADLLTATLRVPDLRLETLGFIGDRNEGLGDGGCRVIAGAERFASLRGLALVVNGIGDGGAAALAESAHLLRLADLDLRHNYITDDGLAALAESSRLPGLRFLDVSLNEFGAAGILTLARSPCLARLSRLSLRGNPIGDEGAIALAESAASAHLRGLEVGECEIGMAGFFRLLDSPHLAGVPRFSMSGNELSPEEQAELKQRFGDRVE
ncbi:MAG: TIGR02996 domain-containing protein [Gemmataceae bacterium]|nr:TIGR02996 domain-containing protein [Gemmataceae bacterium]